MIGSRQPQHRSCKTAPVFTHSSIKKNKICLGGAVGAGAATAPLASHTTEVVKKIIRAVKTTLPPCAATRASPPTKPVGATTKLVGAHNRAVRVQSLYLYSCRYS